MNALKNELHKLCAHNRDGSYATQADRLSVLLLCAEQLRDEGLGLKRAARVKPEHFNRLLRRWEREGLSAGTLKNRVAHLRWWARKVNKPNIIHRDNGKLGIADRKMHNGSKAKTLDLDRLASIPCERMRLSLRLMAAFGLRREEALKFRPRLADGGDCIALQPSWTKGGRPRVVPILNQRQRALLDKAAALVGNDSLIPNELSYIAHLRKFKYATLSAGITNVHGLRHNYAQWRYEALTGRKCPAAGGIPRAELSAVERAHDQAARLVIAEELGHSRVDVTKAYLG